MIEIISNPWYSAMIVLITQIGFIYLRTINVIFTATKKMIPSIVTGMGIGMFWLIGIAIGADAILQLKWQPIIAHLLGGAIGTYYGIKSKRT
jgi:hypothetical protein